MNGDWGTWGSRTGELSEERRRRRRGAARRLVSK